MERWASTWSEPFWASSSTTKIAVSFQNLLLLMASDRKPAMLGVGAYHQGDGAMGVHVVRAVLGVVFHHENRRLFPKLAFADGFRSETGHVGSRGLSPGRWSDGRPRGPSRSGRRLPPRKSPSLSKTCFC